MEDKVFGYKMFLKDVHEGDKIKYKRVPDMRSVDCYFECGTSPFEALTGCSFFNKGKLNKVVYVSALQERLVKDGWRIYAPEITIEKELSIQDLIEAQARWQAENSQSAPFYNIKVFDDSPLALATDTAYARITSYTDYPRIVSSGYQSHMVAVNGDFPYLMAAGKHAIIASNSYGACLSTSGRYTQILSAGYNAKIAMCDGRGEIISVGDNAQIVVSGDGARVFVGGKHSHVMLSGRRDMIKGVEGTYVSVAKIDLDDSCRGFVNGCIGEDGLKPDTWYSLKDGKFSEPVDSKL